MTTEKSTTAYAGLMFLLGARLLTWGMSCLERSSDGCAVGKRLHDALFEALERWQDAEARK